MDIGPGDYVECVNDAAGWVCDLSYLVKGKLYVVLEVLDNKVHGLTGNPSFGINLVGFPQPPSGWDQSRFRKVYRPDGNTFTHLLTDIPSDLEAV
mgnify:CR=1 FL=1